MSGAIILGMDPGAATGMAIIQGGLLVGLMTIEPHQIEAHLTAWQPVRVVYEDSRLQSHVWTGATSRAATAKMARNIGEVDAWCKLIVAVCAKLGINCHGISPKGKGVKLNAAQFAVMTKWAGTSNQHERDAAAVAWPYRRAAS